MRNCAKEELNFFYTMRCLLVGRVHMLESSETGRSICVQSDMPGQSTLSNLYAKVQKYNVMHATEIISNREPMNGYGTKQIPNAIPLPIPTTVRQERINMINPEIGSRIVRSMTVDINIIIIPAINNANAKTRCT